MVWDAENFFFGLKIGFSLGFPRRNFSINHDMGMLLHLSFLDNLVPRAISLPPSRGERKMGMRLFPRVRLCTKCQSYSSYTCKGIERKNGECVCMALSREYVQFENHSKGGKPNQGS